MRVAVAGGTGLVGRFVVDALRTGDHEPVVLARTRGVDLVTGLGLDAALDGVDAVIDVSNSRRRRASAATEFFETATTQLLDAEAAHGVRHHLALSIVGIDRVELGYYQAKRRQEALVRAGRVPWTILRATQFFEFPGQLAASVPGPVLPVPAMRSQPVAASEVGAILAEMAAAEPLRDVAELAGPDVEWMPDLTRRWLHATGSRRLVVPARLPGGVGKAMAGGGLLPGPGARIGHRRVADWLATLV